MSVWIPLRSAKRTETGKYGHLGYKCEFDGVGSLAVPLERREEAGTLHWTDIGIGHSQHPYAYPDKYKPTDIYQIEEGIDLGIELVLEQHFDGVESNIWHLNQDIVFALGLLREGDVWVCPDEGYPPVAQLKRNPDSSLASLEIRAEHLRDYLAARQLAVKLVSYRSRLEITDDASHITWPDGRRREETEAERFETRVTPIHEGGMPYGEEAAVFHVWRTDVDTDSDVPTIGPERPDSTDGRSWRVSRRGRKLYRVEGEVWSEEWIEPASSSPRVRRDRVPSACSFIVDASGSRVSADQLDDEDIGRWLWFHPQVINSLLERRSSHLSWYTRETGGIQVKPGSTVHFGINSKDLLTVYAYDIARSPDWQQRIWMAFNASPDGGVSEELLMSQVKASPADTTASEELLSAAINELDESFSARWKINIFRSHEETNQILGKIHRFRAVDSGGLLALAKDIVRVTADRMDSRGMQKIVPLAKDERRGSLKSLEKSIATLVPSG